MKIKKRFEDWRKLSKKERHYAAICFADGYRYDRNRRLALKFAKKVLRHIKKDAENDCGCGFSAVCVGKPTSCMALGLCTDNPAYCPLDLAKSLVSSLNFERVEVLG